jgi:molybdopterin-biosynthesis enzyme MoeA-like protein
VHDQRAKHLVEESYRRMAEKGVVGRSGLTAARDKLCAVPLGAVPVPNRFGVSPGLLLKLAGGALVLALPGMPDEMQAVLEEALPLMRVDFERAVAEREIESPTSDESTLTPLLDRLAHEFPGVWIQSRPAGSRRTGRRIVIRLEASGASRQEADSTVDSCVKRLLALAAGCP